MNTLTFAKTVKYIEGYDFGAFFNEYNFYDFLDYLDVVSEEYRIGKMQVLSGASKMVFLFADEDYVIKIPFDSGEDWEEDSHGYAVKTYIPFYNAPTKSITDSWDYCKGEEERYETAAAAGFGEYFARTQRVYITSNNIRIYIQPKCSAIRKTKTNSKKTHEEFMIWYNHKKTRLPIDNEKWLNSFIDCYGQKKLRKFLNFLANSEWDDDLTTDNIGYLNDKPVLIDYCGFWEQYLPF